MNIVKLMSWRVNTLSLSIPPVYNLLFPLPVKLFHAYTMGCDNKKPFASFCKPARTKENHLCNYEVQQVHFGCLWNLRICPSSNYSHHHQLDNDHYFESFCKLSESSYAFMPLTSTCLTLGTTEMQTAKMKKTTHRIPSHDNRTSKFKILLLWKWQCSWCVGVSFLEEIIDNQNGKCKLFRISKTGNFLSVLSVFCPSELLRVSFIFYIIGSFQ